MAFEVRRALCSEDCTEPSFPCPPGWPAGHVGLQQPRALPQGIRVKRQERLPHSQPTYVLLPICPVKSALLCSRTKALAKALSRGPG